MTPAVSSLRDWLWQRGEDVRVRAAGVVFVLLLHIILGLLLLSLAPPAFRQKAVNALTVTFMDAPVADEAVEPEQQQEESRETEPDTSPEPLPEQPEAPPAEPAPAEATPVEPPIVPPPEVTTAIAAPPAAPPRPARPPRVYGPPDVSQKPPPDSVRVDGSGPNGEPLYAAQWYREPYDNELRGYLSTSRGPGWGLIACRTVADYRVDDCVIVGEYPEGSGIARSVHAAAWQFRVRPPRVGGKELVGEWVRIRIDYERRGEYAR